MRSLLSCQGLLLAEVPRSPEGRHRKPRSFGICTAGSKTQAIGDWLKLKSETNINKSGKVKQNKWILVRRLLELENLDYTVPMNF